MTLNLYDTKTQQTTPFTPLEEGRVGLYVCGATVQGSPHLGHMRAAVVFDQLRRWLIYKGYEVTLVRNVTDIEDKIIAKSAEAGRPWWAHAYHYEQEFTAAYDAIGVLPPTFEPHATGHVTEMIELIERLIGAGYAYPALDGSGDVYFATTEWEAYGALTHQKLEDMSDAGEKNLPGKKDARDFALWKGTKPGEPATASWPTPWGRGRPGWHLECSAMSTKYLGSAFDIHGGGLDLRFPHHENEMAQSNAAGDAFAARWMHSGLVNIGGEKMSKSLGNSVFATDLFDEYTPLGIRYFLSTAHYRSVLDFTESSVESGLAALDRLRNFLSRARTELAGAAPAVPEASAGYADRVVEVPAEFADAMDDDLSVPRALSVVFASVGEGFKLLEAGTKPEGLARVVAQVELMLDVLGINPSSAAFAVRGGKDEALRSALDALVGRIGSERLAAKQAKDYARADALRDQLTAAGITIEDTPEGFRYHIPGA